MSSCNGEIYKIERGDTIVSISKKFHVRLADLIKNNPQIENPTQLTAGEEICIPMGKGKKQAVNAQFGVELQDGYTIQKFTDNLNFPTGITFSSVGEMFVVESGITAGTVQGTARILRVNPDGSTVEIARGFVAPLLGIAWYNGYLYVAESGYPGQITRVAMDGTSEAVVKGLPTGGDHGLGDIIFSQSGKMYFGVGTATNSGVVGPDNEWLTKRPRYYDLTCRNYELVGQNFVSVNPLTTEPGDVAETGAFHPFGTPSRPDEVVTSNFPCSGAVYEANPDGTGLRVFADGFRYPFGLGFGPGGNVFATDNGMDNRGSRPVANAYDTFEQVFPGEWYGWPDYNARIPVTDPMFRPEGGPQPQFLIKNHPPLASGPVATFTPHSVPTKFDFSFSNQFGYVGQAFVALYGHLYHEGVPLPEPAGFRVVRVDPATGDVNNFLVVLNPGSGNLGVIHPIQAIFGPNGNELYVLDFGNPGDLGRPPARNSGAIWKITR